MTGIAVATEDELSEAIAARLAQDAGLEVTQRLRKNGYGYLRSRIGSWRRMAQRTPILLLTDLDQHRCPQSLIDSWMGGSPQPPGLVFRVAVREVEAWLLADHSAMGQLLGEKARLPPQPDLLPDPKATLLRLARDASRSVREDLTARRGAIASQGLGYNRRLCELVRSGWSPARAAERSPSLARARGRIASLVGANSG